MTSSRGGIGGQPARWRADARVTGPARTLSIESTEPAFWGWIYHGGPNSTFVHACHGGGACPGNGGDITD